MNPTRCSFFWPSVLAALAAACSSTPTAPMPDDFGDQPQVNIPKEWGGSVSEVGAGRAIVTRTGANLSVAKSLRNRESVELHAEFKFTFLDAQGVPLRQQVDWRPMTMAPQMETVFMGTSLGPAEDWRLEIRVAR